MATTLINPPPARGFNPYAPNAGNDFKLAADQFRNLKVPTPVKATPQLNGGKPLPTMSAIPANSGASKISMNEAMAVVPFIAATELLSPGNKAKVAGKVVKYTSGMTNNATMHMGKKQPIFKRGQEFALETRGTKRDWNDKRLAAYLNKELTLSTGETASRRVLAEKYGSIHKAVDGFWRGYDD